MRKLNIGNCFRVRPQRGSVIEFVLAGPIVLVIILSVIDFSRYLTYRGMVESAGQRAVNLASVVSGLDSDTDLEANEAFTKVKERVAGLLDDAGFTDETTTHQGSNLELKCTNSPCIKQLTIDIPGVNADGSSPPAGSLPRRQQQSTTPIRLTIITEFTPVVSLVGNLTMKTVSLTYREPRFNFSLPLVSDCNHNGEYDADGCPCSSDNTKIVQSGVCSCRTERQLVADGQGCKCTDPTREWNQAADACICKACPSNSHSAPIGGRPCNCACDTGYKKNPATGVCECKAAFTNPDGTCQCKKNCNAIPGTHLDTTKCDCVCDNGGNLCTDKTCNTVQCNPDYDWIFNPDLCGCDCPAGELPCLKDNECQFVKCDPATGGSWDPLTCACTCANGTWSWTSGCVPCPCGERLNAEGTACVPDLFGQYMVTCANGRCVFDMCSSKNAHVDIDDPQCGIGMFNQKCECEPTDHKCGTYETCFNDAECSGGMIFLPNPSSPGQCICQCAPTDCKNASGNCQTKPDCGEGMHADPNTCGCVCDAITCPESGDPRYKPDPDHECACKCPDGMNDCTDGTKKYCYDNTLICTGGQVPIGGPSGCGCKCPVEIPVWTNSQCCPLGQVYCDGSCRASPCDPTATVDNACNCGCTATQEMCKDVCYEKCPLGKHRDAATCECICDDLRCATGDCLDSSTCTGNRQPNLQSCKCECANQADCTVEGQTPSEQNNCQCGCPPLLPDTCNDKCVAKCPPGQTHDLQNECQCGCTTQQVTDCIAPHKLNDQCECKCDPADIDKCLPTGDGIADNTHGVDDAECKCICINGATDIGTWPDGVPKCQEVKPEFCSKVDCVAEGERWIENPNG